MKLVTLDFESYWDQEYSLSRLTPLEYVMDPRFEVISCSIKEGDAKPYTAFGRDVGVALRDLDWKDLFCIGHNMSGFDAYVLAYRYGLNPKLWGCTLAMARPLHAKTIGLGLGRLALHYQDDLRAMGINPIKNNLVLLQTRGRHLADFTSEERERMAVYNGEDSDQSYGIFKAMRPHFTPNELWHIDNVIRMRTEPRFVVNRPMLESALSIERSNKHKALIDLGRMLNYEGDWSDDTKLAEDVRSKLASAPKFSQLLEARGVEVPLKPSPKDERKLIPALAKTDQGFIDLQEHEDPVVAAAARARLAVKSTLLETRIGKFLRAAELTEGRLPMPIRAYGADTTWRDSGEEYNPLNLPRINKKAPKVTDALRQCLGVPKDHLVIVSDQSQIELRINHTLWRVPSSMELWKSDPKADLYRAFAAMMYKCTPEAITEAQRQLAKIAQLGLGFGAGARTFQRVAKNMGGINLDLEEAQHVTYAWRDNYREIPAGWKTCHQALRFVEAGQEHEIDPWGLATTCDEGIRLHTGHNHIIRYPYLRQEFDENKGDWEWLYAHGRHKARIYAGKIDENIVQALARDSIMDYTLAFFKETGLRPALRPYDELVYVVPEKRADELLALLQSIMRTPPKWWPELVVWSEGGLGPTYGSAK